MILWNEMVYDEDSFFSSEMWDFLGKNFDKNEFDSIIFSQKNNFVRIDYIISKLIFKIK